MRMRARSPMAVVGLFMLCSLSMGCSDEDPSAESQGPTSIGSSTEGSSTGGGNTDSTTAQSTTNAASTTNAPSTASDTSDDGPIKFDTPVADGGQGGCLECSSDFQSVLTCTGAVVESCEGLEGCDPMSGTCRNACDVAADNQQSVGCEYLATFMDTTTSDTQACFAVFVANTWDEPAHISVEYQGAALPLENFAGIPSGFGPGLTYDAYDPAAGIPPGEVVALFLSGPQGEPSSGFAPCPMPSAFPTGVMLQGASGISDSFIIESDVPVVAYEINPYGGGSAAVTAASLLLPTSAWDTNYVTANAYAASAGVPSMNIMAMQDDTEVTLLPVANVTGGGGIPAGTAGVPMMFTLQRGQHAQISQNAELTGSIIESTKPVGLLGGHTCAFIPTGVLYCDHAEQMIPPVRALGSEYAAVMYRPRAGEPAIWRVLGAVDGTTLTWSSDVGGPATLDQGQVGEFITSEPFVVRSQDEDHPFLLFSYMSGSTWDQGMSMTGHGDSDFVISVPTAQYMSSYVFFADPTYPETNLVVIRRRGADMQFHDVDLDCAGTLGGWQPLDADFEWTRIDLITGDFQGVNGCSTGRHTIDSDAPFGLWVWGWGTPLTSIFTSNVSYGYPAGMNVQPINDVVVDPEG